MLCFNGFIISAFDYIYFPVPVSFCGKACILSFLTDCQRKLVFRKPQRCKAFSSSLTVTLSTSAGASAAAIYCAGSSLYFMISIFSPFNSSTIFATRVPFEPTHVRRWGQRFRHLKQRQFFEREPASLETLLISTTPV